MFGAFFDTIGTFGSVLPQSEPTFPIPAHSPKSTHPKRLLPGWFHLKLFLENFCPNAFVRSHMPENAFAWKHFSSKLAKVFLSGWFGRMGWNDFSELSGTKTYCSEPQLWTTEFGGRCGKRCSGGFCRGCRVPLQNAAMQSAVRAAISNRSCWALNFIQKASARISLSPPGAELGASKDWYVSNIILYWSGLSHLNSTGRLI